MDARKKAGASGALPRERVAEIAKTAKGTTAGQTSVDSTTSGGVEQDKQKVKRWLLYCGKVNTFLVITPSQFSLLHLIFFFALLFSNFSSAFVNRSRISSVGRALDCRAGGHGFDSQDRTNTQRLKITEK